MNLIWHIMFKDLRALRWPFAIWAFGLAALVGLQNISALSTQAIGETPELSIMIGLGVLSALLVALIVQEDSLVTNTAFWRTRPVSRWSLLGAKLAMISLVFLPPFTLFIYQSNEPRMGQEELMNVCVMLGFAAVASVTRNLIQWFFSVLVGWFTFTAALMVVLFGMHQGQVGPKIQRPFGMSLFNLCLLFAGLVAAAALANQYAVGRRWVAIGMLVAAFILVILAQAAFY